MLGDALTGAATTLNGEIADALGAGLPIALPILGIYVGWRLFKRFVKA